MWVVVPLWLVGASVLALGINAFLRGREDLIGEDAPAIEVTKIVLTLVGVVGAVFAGVYAYRKQRLEEGASHRADAAAFADRYNSASGQLGHEKAAVRLAGVYAMTRLADDWREQRQVCIDVLCAYLRMPVKEADPPPGEAEVRSTVVSVIRAHLLDTAPVSWSDKDFDFTGAVLHNTNLRDAIFAGNMTSFTRAQFTGDTTSFDGARFVGETTSFNMAVWGRAKATFDDVTIGPRTRVSGLDDPTQTNGVTITANGQPFTGRTGPPPPDPEKSGSETE